jgi:hypothetical protein
MTPQNRGRALFAVAVVILLVLAFQLAVLNQRVQRLDEELRFTRTVTTGRLLGEVLMVLGPPSKVLTGASVAGRQRPFVLIYNSTAERSWDVWVVLDNDGVVQSVYYPDYAQHREFIDSRKSVSPGELQPSAASPDDVAVRSGTDPADRAR